LDGLCDVVNEQVGPKTMVEHMIRKMQLVSYIHKLLLENVEQTHKKQHKIYASKKRLQMFKGFKGKGTKVKMCKPSKKKNLAGS
jgi:hypothetical protein